MHSFADDLPTGKIPDARAKNKNIAMNGVSLQ